MITVTKTFLPPLEEYQQYIAGIFERDWLTNQGPCVAELEARLKQYLGTPYFNFVTNGTIALQLALRTLDILEGEVITTPFSYVATVSSILWERCQPIFVDIEPERFCIDADRIEAAITPRTKAIMGVHVYGYPCDVEAIQTIGQKYNLPVIYDGAHAFGCTYHGKALLRYGTISTCSFHATKPFHTVEGGCVISNDQEKYNKLSLMLRFGHNNDDHIQLGINGKASELHAAMGLCNLKYISEIIAKRKLVSDKYDQLLKGSYQRPVAPADFESNYAYYPIFFKDEATLLTVREALNQKQIFPRRYFYPSLNLLPYLPEKQACPVSEDFAARVLCLPLYTDLSMEDVALISSIVKEAAA